MGDAAEYLIRKGEYFYRPNCQGYTPNKFEAGRYTKSEAEKEASVEPWRMKAIHQDEWPSDPVSDRIDTLTAERDALRAQVEAMQAENAKLLAELFGARTSVIAFGAPMMAILAQQHGLPDGHLFAAHYDILKKAGARMDSFTRADT